MLPTDTATPAFTSLPPTDACSCLGGARVLALGNFEFHMESPSIQSETYSSPIVKTAVFKCFRHKVSS